MNVPDGMRTAAAAHEPITLRGGTGETPRAVRYAAHQTDEIVLWELEGFTLKSARYFLDNYLEPFGYEPTVDNPDVWTVPGCSVSNSGEKLRE